MTKIVYAAPDISPDVWTPPKGVIVLPLSEHPAIVKDNELVDNERRKYKRKPIELGPLALSVVDYLTTHDEGTAVEIGKNLNRRSGGITEAMKRCPELFEEIGEQASLHCNLREFVTVWGLVQPLTGYVTNSKAPGDR